MSKRIDRILAQGVIAGLVKPVDRASAHAARPWPLTLLTGIGGWFAAIPFAVLLYEIGGGTRSPLLALICAGVLCAATMVLRRRPGLFTEQFSLAAMAAGTLVMYFYIAENGSATTACVTLFGAFALAASLLQQTWLCVLLGAGMAVTGIFGLHSILQPLHWYATAKLWPAMAMSAVWCGVSILPSKPSLPAQYRACLEAVSLGMGAAIVCSPFWVHDTFFFFDTGGWLNRWGPDLPYAWRAQSFLAVGVTFAAAVHVATRWPQCRSLWFATVATVLAISAWHIPSLCLLALIGAVSLVSGRRSIAVLCTAMMVWWMASFYFSLQWALVYKAILFAASGLLLASTTAFLVPANPLKKNMPFSLPGLVRTALVKPTRVHAIALLGCAALSLGIVNISILQKEGMGKAGTTLFVALKPVDPRSIMQGDYMRLSFDIGELAATTPAQAEALIGTMDQRGVWSAGRGDDGTRLAAGEIKINLSGSPSHRIFVTDAWFFKEGEAQRWQSARFGEFRVRADGNAVLVALRGAKLEEL
jgi:uncharacterized membrane-anchored protein